MYIVTNWSKDTEWTFETSQEHEDLYLTPSKNLSYQWPFFLPRPCWECHCPLSPFLWLALCSKKSNKWKCDLWGCSWKGSSAAENWVTAIAQRATEKSSSGTISKRVLQIHIFKGLSRKRWFALSSQGSYVVKDSVLMPWGCCGCECWTPALILNVQLRVSVVLLCLPESQVLPFSKGMKLPAESAS